MSDTHKTKPWYVQVAVENGKKLQRGFQPRSKERHKLKRTGEGWKVEYDRADAEEAAELGTDDPWAGGARHKRFAKGKHNTSMRRELTSRKRRKVKDQIKHDDFDAINNRGTERHDADWYD